MALGQEFMPRDIEEGLRRGLNNSPAAQEALQILALRLPKVIGGSPMAPDDLLRSGMAPGRGAATLPEILREALGQPSGGRPSPTPESRVGGTALGAPAPSAPAAAPRAPVAAPPPSPASPFAPTGIAPGSAAPNIPLPSIVPGREGANPPPPRVVEPPEVAPPPREWIPEPVDVGSPRGTDLPLIGIPGRRRLFNQEY